MLVQITRAKPGLQRCLVEEGFPTIDAGLLIRRRGLGWLIDDSVLSDPVLQYLVVFIGKTRHRQRHPLQWLFVGITVKFRQLRTLVLALQS